MKYSNIADVQGKYVRMDLACSRCGKSVEKDDLYCSHCGNKLEYIPKFIGKEDLLDTINKHKYNEYKKSSYNKDCDISVNDKFDSTSIKCCTGGRTSCEGCPHITTDGYCTMLVCTSMPPQYERCKFSKHISSQFKLVCDVGKLLNPKCHNDYYYTMTVK